MSDALVKRLHEERLNLWENQKELLDTVTAAGRDLDAAENGEYEKRNARIDEIDARVAELVEDQRKAKESEEAFRALLDTPREPGHEGRGAKDENAQLRAFFRGETGRAMELVPASERSTVFPQAAGEVRDLTVGTATAGGNTVPISFYDRLMAHLIEVSGVLSAAPTVLQTDSGEQLQIPKTTAHSSAVLVAEAAAITESDPAFAQARLDAYKYGLLLQISRELVEDTGVDLLGYLAMQAGRAVGNAIGADFVTGDGSSKPQGIVPVASAGVTGGTGVSGAFTADNLIDLYYSVIEPYRNSKSCSWLMRDATVGALRKLKNGDSTYLWSPATTPGAPDSFLSKPIHTDPNVAAVATTAKSVVFGDFSQFFVRFVRGIRFERSDDYAFANDLITYRCLVRGDSELVDRTGAVKVFTGGAS